MVKNEKKTFKDLVPGIMSGSGMSLIIMICLIMIASLLIASGRVGEEKELVLVMICCFVGSVGGGAIARHKNAAEPLASAFGSAAVTISIRLIVSMFSEAGSLIDSEDIMVTCAILCGGVLAGICRRSKKRRRH